MRIKMKKKN